MASVLKRLESEVTCPLCLDIFTEPKKLSCDHVYCMQCIRGLALRSTTGAISCPECRTNTAIPSEISQLPTSHRVIRLVEMYQQSPQLAEPEESAQQPTTCEVHSQQPLALYCETCQKLVCRDCALNFCAKINHKHGFIDEMIEKYLTNLKEQAEPIQMLHKQMSNAFEAVSVAETQLRLAKETKLQQSESTFDSLAEIIAQERQYFRESIEKSFEKQEKINSSKKSEISEVLAKLESIIQITDHTPLKEEVPAFLGGMGDIERNIEHVTELARNVSPQPPLLPEMKVELLSPDKFRNDCYSNNFMYTQGDPLKSHMNRSCDLSNLLANETTTITLHIDPQNAKRSVFGKVPIAALLICNDGSSETVGFRRLTPEQYLLSFIPRKKGRHELHIIYDDTHMLCGSPIPIYVTNPHQLEPISSTQIHNSGGIKCCGGKIYVCNINSGFAILNSTTKAIERTVRLPGVGEILPTKEHIYATDARENRVIKIDASNNIIKSVGEIGNTRNQFNFPNGIRMNKDGEIYVCDTRNHRIKVFDEELNLIRVFGRQGDARGCFVCPDDLDFDEAGNIYVTEESNHRIQVLTPTGEHIRYIGRPGSRPGELNRPCSPAIYKNMIYVTELRNNRISVFKLTGEFVSTFGNGIPYPTCIAIDEDGYIHLTSNGIQVITFAIN